MLIFSILPVSADHQGIPTGVCKKKFTEITVVDAITEFGDGSDTKTKKDDPALQDKNGNGHVCLKIKVDFKDDKIRPDVPTGVCKKKFTEITVVDAITEFGDGSDTKTKKDDPALQDKNGNGQVCLKIKVDFKDDKII